MALWSGVNLVLGKIACGVNEPAVVTIKEVFAVEEDLIYDFYGFAYSWPEMRKRLIEAGKEAQATRPSKCVPSKETAPSENPQSGKPACSVALQCRFGDARNQTASSHTKLRLIASPQMSDPATRASY